MMLFQTSLNSFLPCGGINYDIVKGSRQICEGAILALSEEMRGFAITSTLPSWDDPNQSFSLLQNFT